MSNEAVSLPPIHGKPGFLERPLPRRYLSFIGRTILRFTAILHRQGAFALITLGVTVTKFNLASRVVHPLIFTQIYRGGVRLLPMITFMALALGMVIIGQVVSLLTRVGAQDYLGAVMAAVVVRELGPLVTALLVLARIGTASVVELGTARAQGEVEALEALGIDPIHYLVVPQVMGLAIAVFSLTVYLILGSIVSGYLFSFLQNVPLPPDEYFRQLAGSLRLLDFIVLALKTLSFGTAIAIICSYQGLARPLQLEDVAGAATRAVTQSVVVCVVLDALFILVYLLL